MLDRLRLKHPDHVPCIFMMPGEKKLKILMPREATVSHALLAARQRWQVDQKVTETEALFSFIDGKMCVGTKRLAQLDINPPQAVVFQVRREDTFG